MFLGAILVSHSLFLLHDAYSSFYPPDCWEVQCLPGGKKLLAILKGAFSFSLYVYFQRENDLKISMHQVFPLSIILATNKENYESESHIKGPGRSRKTSCWMEASLLQSKDSQRCLQSLIQSLPGHLQTAPCWMSSILAIVSFKSWVKPSLQFACWNKLELNW